MRFFLWCLCGMAVVAGAAERTPIFPEPQKLTILAGSFAVDDRVSVLVPEPASPADLALARAVIAEFSDRYGVAVRMVAGGTIPAAGRFILMGTATSPLVKQYLGKHQVLYVGRPDGEGSILGTWSIGEHCTGPFLLRPVVAKPRGDEPIQEIG